MLRYFVPSSAPKLSPSEIESLGLGHIADGKPTQFQSLSGPDGETGIILHRPTAGKPLLYSPQQTWQKAPGKNWYVGYETLPELPELQRAEILPGEAVSDERGIGWHVPHARQFADLEATIVPFCGLPQRMKLNEQGAWIPGAVGHRYQRLWELVCEYEQAIADAFAKQPNVPSVQVEFPPIDELAIAGLAANYHVSAVEVDLLGGYGFDFRRRVIHVLRGIPIWEKLQKKTALPGGDSSPGERPSQPGNG